MSVYDEGKTPAPEELEADIVIEGGLMLSMAHSNRPVEDVSVYVKDGVIVRVAKNEKIPHDKQPRPPEKIDATHGIIMPGLINAHSHSAMTLFRGYADDLPLKRWLFEKIFPLEAQYLNPQTAYWGSLLGCLEMIASGTTCFLDGYFFQDETIRAAHKAGLRALVAQGVIDFPAPGVKDPKENISVAKRFVEKWQGFSGLIVPGIFCHSPATCSRTTLERALQASMETATPLQIHLSETIEEVTAILEKTGKRPVHYLRDIGVLNEHLIAAHAIHLDDDEIEILAEHHVKAAYVPQSNMKLASGVASVCKLLAAGLSVGLGTDGSASNNDLDLFLEMDTAAKLAKVFTGDPVSLNARETLAMATQGGASLLGLEKQVGTLEVGKCADIIVIDLDVPHLRPLYDPYSALVYSASGADVKDVIVNGRVLMKNRIFTTLDREEVMGQVRKISKEVRTGVR